MLGKQLLLIILLLPFAAAFVSWYIGRKSEGLRDIFNIAVTSAEFIMVLMLSQLLKSGNIYLHIPDVMGEGLYLLLDNIRYLFVLITSFIWLLTTVYSTQYLIRYKNRNRYYAFFMVTLGSVIGVFISQDLLNLFTFFEIMSFSSYLLVIHDEDKYAHEAGASYIAVAIIGGLILLLGLILIFDYTGNLDIQSLKYSMKHLGNIKYVIAALLLVGFGVKAGLMPFHIWLPKAHPAAPSPASAILSGVLLKTGVFGILLTLNIMDFDYYLSVVLIILGFITMFFGGFFAMLQKHLKRILAFSSMSQVGYIIVGIGLVGMLQEHGGIAIYGALLHTVSHGLYKVLLFLGAGIIYMVLHEMNINAIKGFGRNKLILKTVVLIGFLGLIGMPGFAGFASKTLLHEALLEAAHISHSPLFKIGEIIFTLSSSFTVAYMLKAYITVFVQKNDAYYGQHKKYIKKRALLPLVALSIAIIFIGLMPGYVLTRVDSSLEGFGIHGVQLGELYTFHNIINVLLPMLLGFVIYKVFIKGILTRNAEGERIYFNPIPEWLNMEELIYIPMGKILFKLGLTIFLFIDTFVINVVDKVSMLLNSIGDIKVYSAYSNSAEKPRIEASEEEENNHYSLQAIENYIKTTKIISPKIRQTLNNKHKDKDKDMSIVHGDTAKQHYNLKLIFEKMRQNFNSTIYSVFVFASALVVILLILVFQ